MISTDLKPPAELADEPIALARRAATDEAGDAAAVGEYIGAVVDDDAARTVAFAAALTGYNGWQWTVTLAQVAGGPWTVSEAVLLPGSDALLAPEWVPWDQRVRHGDLGAGELLPADADDDRLAPAYLQSDDPAVEEVAHELGIGRVRVLSRDGRADAADRWHSSEFGPNSEMAEQAPGRCAGCGFFQPLAGSLGVNFGVCANELSPADGRVVDVGYGCGAHSEEAAASLHPVSVADAVIDELQLDVHRRPTAEPDPGTAIELATSAIQALIPGMVPLPALDAATVPGILEPGVLEAGGPEAATGSSGSVWSVDPAGSVGSLADDADAPDDAVAGDGDDGGRGDGAEQG